MNIKVTLHGFEGQGRTLTEAKADANAQLGKAVDGSYQPVVMSLRGNMLLVWREPVSGWQSRLLNNVGDYSIAMYGNSGCADRATCILEAKAHLCRVAWNIGGDNAAVLAFCPPSLKADLLHWASWQEDYARLRAEGKTDVEAHQFARA